VSLASRILVTLCLAGCSGATLPPPGVVSVDPADRPASSAGPVTVMLDAVLPTLADHGAGTVTVDDRLTMKIGPRPFGPSHWTDAGVVTDFLPSVLPEGSYDVTVELGDGRLATATSAFRVTRGDWPVGYTVDTIGDQTNGVPFGVTIRARGAPDGGRRDGEPLGPRRFRRPRHHRGLHRWGPGGDDHRDRGRRGIYHLEVSDLAGRTGRSLNFFVRQ
jgi:hypothetical protein